jgi:hypothetical protein
LSERKLHAAVALIFGRIFMGLQRTVVRLALEELAAGRVLLSPAGTFRGRRKPSFGTEHKICPMVTVAQIKEKLPNWPDAVVSEWLLYFANDIGWPPAEPFGSDRWGGILGGRPLSWWNEVTWKEESVDCSFGKLSKAAQGRVGDIINQIRTKKADAVTTRRYQHPFKYIMENGVFPNPMVAMRAQDGLSFIDGNYRMAAFTDLQGAPAELFEKRGLKKPSVMQNVWIGSHPKGELPRA